MRLVGPKEVTAQFPVDGGYVRLSEGVATFWRTGDVLSSRDVPEDTIPQNVWALGFHVEPDTTTQEEKPASKAVSAGSK